MHTIVSQIASKQILGPHKAGKETPSRRVSQTGSGSSIYPNEYLFISDAK